jgi:hypothetical protein
MKKINIDDLLDNTYEFANFHDSTIINILIDYAARKAIFTFELNVGNIELESEKQKRASGILSFEQLQYFVSEPPDEKYNFEDSNGLTVSGDGPLQETQFKAPLPILPAVKDDAFVHWFYIVEWNSFIFISAKKATFTWQK